MRRVAALCLLLGSLFAPATVLAATPAGLRVQSLAALILPPHLGHPIKQRDYVMDRETLLAHRSHWGEEPEPARHDLSRLTAEEATLYDDLRFDRHQPGLRLEQERIGFGWACDRLAGIPSRSLVSPPRCP